MAIDSHDFTLPDLGMLDLGGDFKLNLDYYLKHPYDDISQAAIDLPSIIEWINIQLQGITEQKLIQRQELKAVRGRIYIQCIQGGWNDYVSLDRRPTDKGIEAIVDAHPDVETCNRELAVLTGWASRLGNLLYVLQAKLDLVRSTESTRRKLVSDDNDDNRGHENE